MSAAPVTEEMRAVFRDHLEPMESPLAFLEGAAEMVAVMSSSPCMIPASALLPLSRELARLHEELDAAFEAAWKLAGGKT